MKYEKAVVLKQFLLPSQIYSKYRVATVLFLAYVFIQINSMPASGYSSHRVKQQRKTGLNALPLEMTKTLAAIY